MGGRRTTPRRTGLRPGCVLTIRSGAATSEARSARPGQARGPGPAGRRRSVVGSRLQRHVTDPIGAGGSGRARAPPWPPYPPAHPPAGAVAVGDYSPRRAGLTLTPAGPCSLPQRMGPMGRVSWRRFPLVFARACRPCPIVATRSQNRVEGAQEEAQCRYGAGRPHGGATGGAAWVVCRPSALKYRGRLQGGSRFRLIWTCVWLVGQDFFFFLLPW